MASDHAQNWQTGVHNTVPASQISSPVRERRDNGLRLYISHFACSLEPVRHTYPPQDQTGPQTCISALSQPPHEASAVKATPIQAHVAPSPDRLLSITLFLDTLPARHDKLGFWLIHEAPF